MLLLLVLQISLVLAAPHNHTIIRKSKVQTVSACNETCAQTCTSHSIHCVISLIANCAVCVLLPHLPSM
jgi:hypothetical protein